MNRVMVDCRKTPSEANCQVTIAGSPEEVMALAVWHDVNAHGHVDGPELRAAIEKDMTPVDAAMA
ncbi:Protein of unknown function [Arthrobacter alpinus]|uniref:Uncharacterized protein n=1 Tax=Arthrobacter alpinus TaxID=656366 RepID=A0A0U3PWA4_9MICC|nr:DUF1059 domain-containing protein [Arthrobacter alpinus]ALV46696.1 hypothetical protein MB46_15560 [Arthrobacter alpinus]SEE95742.1 Protein of unknown function [Arthrobacter alpinus]